MSAETVYQFILTTDQPDANGNVSDILGWDLRRYKANPVVFFNHAWYSPPIGKTLSLETQHDRILANIELANTAVAQEIAGLLEGGFIRGSSPSWVPKTWDYRLNENGRPIGIHSHTQELIEVSIVGIPADPGALRTAMLKDQTADTPLLTAAADHLLAIHGAQPVPQLDRMLGFVAPTELDAIINQLRAFRSRVRGRP